MNTDTKKAKILAYLKAGQVITPAFAFSRIRCLSWSQRIGNLKREGYDIRDEYVNRNGSRFKRYWMPKARKAS